MKKKSSEIIKLPNPFKFGTIVDNDRFCNRIDELRTLKQYVYDGYSVWLFSPRRYGKSSLVKKAFAQIDDSTTIYIDLYNVKSIDDFAKKYSKALGDNLFNWKTGIKKISTTLSKYFSSLYPKVSVGTDGIPSMSIEKKEINQQVDIEQILNMPEKFAQDNNIKICIAFDEFQEVERIDPFIINWMRTAFQNHKHISYIFLGSKQSLMKEIFADIESPFYEFAVKMDLAEISSEDLSEFIKNKFDQNKIPISKNTIDEILKRSERHPHFTQYFASVVFDAIRYGENQDDEDFADRWMDKIINSQGIIFQTIYDQLASNQRSVISAIAQMEDKQELFSDKVRKDFGLPVSSSIAITLKALIKKSLVYKTPEGKYRIDNPVFKEWIYRLNTGGLR